MLWVQRLPVFWHQDHKGSKFNHAGTEESIDLGQDPGGTAAVRKGRDIETSLLGWVKAVGLSSSPDAGRLVLNREGD